MKEDKETEQTYEVKQKSSRVRQILYYIITRFSNKI